MQRVCGLVTIGRCTQQEEGGQFGILCKIGLGTNPVLQGSTSSFTHVVPSLGKPWTGGCTGEREQTSGD